MDIFRDTSFFPDQVNKNKTLPQESFILYSEGETGKGRRKDKGNKRKTAPFKAHVPYTNTSSFQQPPLPITLTQPLASPDTRQQ